MMLLDCLVSFHLTLVCIWNIFFVFDDHVVAFGRYGTFFFLYVQVVAFGR